MFVYVLETNTTGSGLDILRCNEGKCILVTSDIQKYRNDISYSELHRENTISFDTFNHMVGSSNWAGKEPMAIISNSDRRLADAINYSTKLGLPCPNIGTLASFMDKSEFRRSSESNGVPTPKYGINYAAKLWGKIRFTQFIAKFYSHFYVYPTNFHFC